MTPGVRISRRAYFSAECTDFVSQTVQDKTKNKIKTRAPMAREEEAALDFRRHFDSNRIRSRA